MQIRVLVQDSAHSSVAGQRVALFNARSVGTPVKRCEIFTYSDENAISLMFLTKTWLRSDEDEAKTAKMYITTLDCCP